MNQVHGQRLDLLLQNGRLASIKFKAQRFNLHSNPNFKLQIPFLISKPAIDLKPVCLQAQDRMSRLHHLKNSLSPLTTMLHPPLSLSFLPLLVFILLLAYPSLTDPTEANCNCGNKADLFCGSRAIAASGVLLSGNCTLLWLYGCNTTLVGGGAAALTETCGEYCLNDFAWTGLLFG